MKKNKGQNEIGRGGKKGVGINRLNMYGIIAVSEYRSTANTYSVDTTERGAV